MSIMFTILGEPASKANSREIVTRGGTWTTIAGKKVQVGGRPMVIKSEKARNYEADALRQIPPAAKQMLEGPVVVILRIYYASERPDLDESVILDVLQAKFDTVEGTDRRVLTRRGVYINDRQVREKHVYWDKDASNPRTAIEVRPLQAQQVDMLGGLAEVSTPAKRAQTLRKPVPVPETVGEGDPF